MAWLLLIKWLASKGKRYKEVKMDILLIEPGGYFGWDCPAVYVDEGDIIDPLEKPPKPHPLPDSICF